MVQARQVLFLILFLLSALISCSKSTKHDTYQLPPGAYREASLIALCLSGELEAPEFLSNEVLIELATIRSIFGDDYPITRLEFMPPWVVGCLIVVFDDTTAEKVANGEYQAWDQLNHWCQVTKINIYEEPRHNFVKLNYEKLMHPNRLGELYQNLPGVIHSHANYLEGDWPNVYPRKMDGTMTYLFRYAWGDCPAGCIYNEYWYFIFEGDRPLYVGHWVPYYGPELPKWWEEAKLNQEAYRSW
jgi:hypothetical protein